MLKNILKSENSHLDEQNNYLQIFYNVNSLNWKLN